jgi:uncharacterized membrane protein YfcA
MTVASLALIGTTIVFSSFVSGVFGMAGGMVLLAVLLTQFDVTTTMVLFSIIQIGTNGLRAVHWRKFVIWPIFWKYVVGAVLAFAIMRFIAFVPEKWMVYVLLGTLPFMVELLPREMRPSIQWRGIPFVSGFLTTIVQLMAGVGGMFLDLFFQKSTLDRKTTNATKAVTQTFSHLLRGAYFFSLSGVGELSATLWAPAVVLALIGGALAPFVVERMTDDGFRQWTRWIIFVLAGISLLRGAWLLWQGY